jgi:hypothetical protein
LICSGYLLDAEEFEADTGFRPEGFVQKPYNVATLAQMVRKTIDKAEKKRSQEVAAEPGAAGSKRGKNTIAG